jgi:hypothetical protein
MMLQKHSRGVLSIRADKFPTHFQQIFAAFCLLLPDLYIFLFFSILASKSRSLLITNDAFKTQKFKPNSKRILFKCRYSDTRINLVLNIVRQTDKPFQTFVA